MRNVSARAWLCLAALSVSIGAAQAPALVVKDAWVRKTPGADVAAVYLSLRNTSLQPIIVIGVQSPLARRSMLHETSVAQSQSQMRMHDRLVIAPGQTVSFAPGGLHIMLSGLKHGMAAGQSVPLVLLLADGGQLAVAALVRPLAGQKSRLLPSESKGQAAFDKERVTQ